MQTRDFRNRLTYTVEIKSLKYFGRENLVKVVRITSTLPTFSVIKML